MKTKLSRKGLIEIIAIIVLLAGVATYLVSRKISDAANIMHFGAERDSITLPAYVTLGSASFQRYSQAGLPHYAPHAIYFYTYDSARKASAYADITAALQQRHLTIVRHDYSTPGRNVGSDWYIAGEDAAKKIDLSYSATGNTIRLVASRVGDIEPDSN